MRRIKPSRPGLQDAPGNSQDDAVDEAPHENGRRHTSGMPSPAPVHPVKDYSDHIRALVSQRPQEHSDDSDLESDIRIATALLLDRQQENGSFSTGDTRFQAVEPTAHALIALQEREYPQDKYIDSAVEFLTDQIRADGSVRSAADAVDAGWPNGPGLDPDMQSTLPPRTGIRRTHLAALVLLALAGWEDTVEATIRIQRFLLSSSQAGIWGPYPEAAPRPASTALALCALTATGYDPRRFAKGGTYLQRAQRPGGWWPPDHEMWAVRDDNGVHLEVSRIDTTAYGLIALVRIGGAGGLIAAARAFRHLKFERRLETDRWQHRSRTAKVAIPPAGSSVDEITAALGTSRSSLALLLSALWSGTGRP